MLQSYKDAICPKNKSFYPNHAHSCLGFGKLFNVLQSPIDQVASQPMRNIETFPSKHMYLYLSLEERKVAEFYTCTHHFEPQRLDRSTVGVREGQNTEQ